MGVDMGCLEITEAEDLGQPIGHGGSLELCMCGVWKYIGWRPGEVCRSGHVSNRPAYRTRCMGAHVARRILLLQLVLFTVSRFISEKLGRWYAWHTVLLALSTVTFGYVALLFLLALLHTGYGHEMYMHKVHKGMLLLVLTACITATNCATSLWPDGWTLMYLAILASWPFIHLAVIIVMTLLTLVIAKRWMYLYTIGARVASLALFVAVVLFIYVSPLLVQPPCVLDAASLPLQPALIAHRGGASLAPENTLLAFQLSNQYAHVIGFECDVQISLDGVPFLLRDTDLRQTTDVETKFPLRQEEPATNFNMTDLQTLDAGSWFLQADPFDTSHHLELKLKIRNQSVPTLAEVLRFVRTTNNSLEIHIQPGPPTDHPHAEDYKRIIVQVIIQSGINPQKILWHYYNENVGNMSFAFRRLAMTALSTRQLANESTRVVNLPYMSTDLDLFSVYAAENVSVNLYTVNSLWLYSLYWCAGVNSVTTNEVRALSTLRGPIWRMSPLVYFIMWVATDVVSAIIIICIFVYNRVKKSGAIFNPETLSLQAMQHRISQTKQNRNMKEKLLHAAESIQDMENGISGLASPSTPVTPATPATPATIETPTTPLSPITPNLTIHGEGKHHAGVISFSRASGFFGENSVAPQPVQTEPQHDISDRGEVRSSSQGVYNEALSPKTGHEGSPPHHVMISNGPPLMNRPPLQKQSFTRVTDKEVRGFFESPPLKTEHYRSLSENYTNGFIAATDAAEKLSSSNDQRPCSDLIVPNPHHPKSAHFRSSSATIPHTFFGEIQSNGGIVPPRRGPYADTRSSSLNSDVPVACTTVLHTDASDPIVLPHLSTNRETVSPINGCRPDGINHTDISIEVS